MDAIILNSGLGNRMGDFTRSHHKSMAVLKNGETIFERQLRILREGGIRNFVVTVGPFAQQLREKAAQPRFRDCTFTWVPNPIYDKTNYIYSLYLARDFLKGDSLLLHGDLVFTAAFLKSFLADPRQNLGAVQPELPLPEKDFKARIEGGRIKKISVKIFGEDCSAFQPMYKLSGALLKSWLDRIGSFVHQDNTQVYAEEALNELLEEDCVLEAFDCGRDFIGEVDNLEDLERAGSEVRLCDFRNQETVTGESVGAALSEFLRKRELRKVLLVAGKSLEQQPFAGDVLKMPAEIVRFSSFTANPDFEEILAATALYRETGCEGVIAIGGGTAIDIAKCVKLFAAQDSETELLGGNYAYSPIPMLAIPTTAGTGSEATRSGVVYVNGVKHSIQHDCMLPDTAVLAPQALAALPDYQKKCTLLDAMCQCVESIWSVKATEESRGYAEKGLRLLLENKDAYLCGIEESAGAVMLGANFGGKAINLTQTTAAHAMSYVLTKKLGLPHGHAVFLCMKALLPGMMEKFQDCPGSPAFTSGFSASVGLLEKIFAAETPVQLSGRLIEALELPDMPVPDWKGCKAPELAASVNAQRLANHPMKFTEAELERLYERMQTG